MVDVQPNFKVPAVKKPAKGVRAVRGGKAAAAKRKATALHAAVVKARDAGCVRCNDPDGRLECAHIFSRGYSAVRTDEGNAVALHSGCHRYLTRNPHEHVTFFQNYLGLDAYNALKDKAYQGTKRTYPLAFWEAECVRLSALLERYGA